MPHPFDLGDNGKRAGTDTRATANAPGAPPASDSPAIALIARWFDLSELERRTFVALTRELTVSSELIETSTIDLSERFQALTIIAQAQMGRVEKVATIAESIVVDGQALPLEVAMHSVEDVLLKIIDTIVTVSKLAMRMVFALEDVARDVVAAEQSVAQIDSINTKTRYLALNAAIEASRSGQSGGAFRVIAGEVKALSLATEETSKQVSSRIASVARGVRNGHKVLQEIATMDMTEHLQAKERLGHLSAGIIAQNRTVSAVLMETAAASAEMSATIGRLVTGMQFQDRTKQHLGQVVDALGVLKEGSESVRQATQAAFPGQFDAGAIDQKWLNRIIETQTLGVMKQRLLTRLLTDQEVSDDPHREHNDDGSGDIELF